MKKMKTTPTVSLLLCLIGCVLSFHVFGAYRGFIAASTVNRIADTASQGLMQRVWDPYFAYVDIIRAISFLTIIIAISLFLDTRLLARVVRTLFLITGNYLLFCLVRLKYLDWNPQDVSLELARVMLPYEVAMWVLLGIFVIIDSIDLVSNWRTYFSSSSHNG